MRADKTWRLEDDADSALASLISSTRSLSSSCFLRHRQFGREYLGWFGSHSRYSEGKYLCPIDTTEQEREDIQNYVFTLLFLNKLYFAPLSETDRLKVLDLCTGTGAWVIDLGDERPNWDIEGVDLSPHQPAWCPPNVHFCIDNV